MTDVVSVVNTCEACPAQWEGRTTDEQVVYARYRFGILRVGVGATLQDAVHASMFGDDGFRAELGDAYDGFLDFAELKAATAGIVNWPIAEKVKENGTTPPSGITDDRRRPPKSRTR